MTFLTGLLAAEGIPGGSPLAVLAAPLGILAFIGSVYLLVRSNLGTRRGYLVTATALMGFLLIQSAFWTFGAPGTPQATGPGNLPGQPADAYQPTWTAFAQDSLVAERPEYADVVAGYPETFTTDIPADFADEAEAGVGDIQTFFASEEGGEVIEDVWAVEQVEYAVADNGFPVLAVTYREVDEALQPVPDGATETLFGFFDEGAPLFPGLIFILISGVLFALHAVLLYFDENRERRDLESTEAAPAERERVPAGA